MDPLIFEPYLRPMVWGNRRLGDVLRKTLPGPEPYGECWEISAHPHHVSRVAEGPRRGELLTDLYASAAGDLFGATPPNGAPSNGAPSNGAGFPWLIKLLDCQERLSIQVHPNDEQARRLSKENTGKTEAWIVMDVHEDGWIYAGLNPGITRAVMEEHVREGTVAECLHFFKPQVGDCVFLQAGTVHAVVGGVMLAEVQQSSDVTFRLFDWNRIGAAGQRRCLHVHEALECINWSAGPVYPVRGEPLPGLPPGVQGEILVRCPYFVLQRFHLKAPLTLLAGNLSAWLVLEGSAELKGPGYSRLLVRGETVLIPAAASGLTWHPQGQGAQLLESAWP